MNSPIYKNNGGSKYKNPEIEKLKSKIDDKLKEGKIQKSEHDQCIKDLDDIANNLLTGSMIDFNFPI